MDFLSVLASALGAAAGAKWSRILETSSRSIVESLSTMTETVSQHSSLIEVT
jgi:hypothetical protein